MAESAIPLLRPESAHYVALRAANRMVDLLAAIDRCARREHRTVPTRQERNMVHEEFWAGLVPTLAWVESVFDALELAQMRCAVQTVLNQWFLRSRLWARSFLKPHGYAGDFRTLEWMYELERDDCADVTQPAAINLLDGLYRSVHSVQAMWHRRAWFANLIADAGANRRRPTRVLDVAWVAVGTCAMWSIDMSHFRSRERSSIKMPPRWRSSRSGCRRTSDQTIVHPRPCAPPAGAACGGQ